MGSQESRIMAPDPERSGALQYTVCAFTPTTSKSLITLISFFGRVDKRSCPASSHHALGLTRSDSVSRPLTSSLMKTFLSYIPRFLVTPS